MTKSVIRILLCSALMLIAPLSYSSTTVQSTQELSKSLNEKVSVSGQMSSEKFLKLMGQGFKSVIVNRPDHETGNNVTAAELRSIAEKLHVSLIYQPVISGQISTEDVHEFAKYYNSLPKPILLVCKSGSRSTVLFNQAKSLGLLNE